MRLTLAADRDQSVEHKQQRRCPRADLLRQWRRAARIEVELDSELAEAGELLAAARIGHAMQQTDRGAAEMGDPGFDQVRLTEARRVGDPQGELKGREAAALRFYILCGHANRRCRL